MHRIVTDQAQITVMIKYAQSSKSSDQGQTLGYYDFDPDITPEVLGNDYPLLSHVPCLVPASCTPLLLTLSMEGTVRVSVFAGLDS